MKNHEVRAVMKYLYFFKIMLQEIFYDMKESLVKSAPAFSTVAKWCAEFTRGLAPM